MLCSSLVVGLRELGKLGELRELRELRKLRKLRKRNTILLTPRGISIGTGFNRIKV
ncbi:MAG: hypothetical protein F6K21_33805 [Symploca sp. SIO2D2]|nr:hypothetical protein [Symploca sp. SIO2D2]